MLLGFVTVCCCLLTVVRSAESDQPDCPTCPMASRKSRTPLRADKLRFEQEKILSKLRLEKPPDVHVSLDDLSSMLLKRLNIDVDRPADVDRPNLLGDTRSSPDGPEQEEYETADDREPDDGQSSNVKGMYIFGQPPLADDPNCPAGQQTICVDFQINSELLGGQIVNASLWLFKTSGVQRSPVNLSLSVVELSEQGDERPLTQVQVDGITGWQELDVGERLSERSGVASSSFTSGSASASGQRSSVRRRLRLKCLNCIKFGVSIESATERLRPFLELKLDRPAAVGRRKRSYLCAPDVHTSCCLKKFYVNFTELGWNSWILQPRGYYANYCNGNCRLTATTNYNNVIRNVGDQRSSNGEPADSEHIPCCAPTRMSSLTMLYAYAPGKIMKNTIQNMVVDSCGC